MKAYPRKIKKKEARQAFDDAIAAGASPEEIIGGAERYRDDPTRENRYTLGPVRWLDEERWTDEPTPQSKSDTAAHEALKWFYDGRWHQDRDEEAIDATASVAALEEVQP